MKRVVIALISMLAAVIVACTAKRDPNEWVTIVVNSTADSAHLKLQKLSGNARVKIVGEINEKDFGILRACQTLYYLDLSEASIVGKVTLAFQTPTKPVVTQMGNAIPAGAFGSVAIYNPQTQAYSRVEAHKTLRSLVLPTNVSAIGSSAFSGCGLNHPIIFPQTVTQIYDSAFNACGYLIGQIILPNNLTYLGAGAFNQCANVTGEIVIPESIDSIAQYTFSNCGGISKITFPKAIKKIGRNAFAATSITSLVLPASLVSIEANAFRNCRSLVGSLDLPENLNNVGDRAFEFCGFDGTLTLNASLRAIGLQAFDSTEFVDIIAKWTDQNQMPAWNAAQLWFPENFESTSHTQIYSIKVPPATLNLYQSYFSEGREPYYNFEQQ